MVKEEERELHKLMSNYAKGEKNMKRKLRIIVCILATILAFGVYPIDSFAMETKGLPEKFKELSFEERFAWVTENVEAEYVQGKKEERISGKGAVDPMERTHYTAYRSSGIKREGNEVCKIDVRYKWSVETASPNNTVRIDSVNVQEYVYIPHIRKDGPTVSKSVNQTIGIGQCEVHLGLLNTFAYYDLYQYATLHYHGGTHFREVADMTG